MSNKTVTLEDILKPYQSCIENGKFEYDDRHFEMKVPNPWDGCALFNMISSYRIPFSIDILFHAPSRLPMLPEDGLKDLQMLCLKYCFEVLQANKAQVVDENGYFGIIESTVTAPLIYHLTVGYLFFFEHYWNAADSLSLLPGVPNSAQQKQ